MKTLDGIDIIIPIYNAFEDLQKCISSIFSYTDLNKHRLILVDDASPDPRIEPYLLSLRTDRVLVEKHKKNLGFSASINSGIKVSGNRDVLLLNSDTIVTPNWLEKIIQCAYSNSCIATVTPLSNNATLCSVPEFLKENKLPVGYSLEEYSSLIEEISLCSYPQIPVANGFCMYIKREVIDKVGGFDADTFERGYGEENDFCYRAEQIGYCHVMCDNTYIYHSGTASFMSDEKRKYIEFHEQILNQRYPEQSHAVAVHCRDNPNSKIQENIKLWTALRNGRKNLLYLVQSDFRKDADDHLGGTQLHVKDLTSCMRKNYNVFVAARNVDFLNVTVYMEAEEYSFKFYIKNKPIYFRLYDQQFARVYGNILDLFQIDLIHIHHTKDLTLEMYYEASKRELPIFTTLHDFYMICPSIKLIDYSGHLCNGISNGNCQNCQKNFWNMYEGIDYIPYWQCENLKALSLSSEIFTPSESAKDIIGNVFPELSEKIHVISHGMPSFSCPGNSSSSTFNVALLGGLSDEKGGKISYQLIKHSPANIKWHLFGVWGYNDLSMLKQKNYVTTGLYERDELPALMSEHRIDLVCILPIWPETFCYTLSEAIQCHAPAIVTDIGALGERMQKLKCGWIVSVEHAYEETLEILNRIKDKGQEYQEKRDLTFSVPLKTLDEMCQEYSAIYQSYIDKKKHLEYTPSLECIKEFFAAFMLGEYGTLSVESNLEEVQERMKNLEEQLTKIKTSLTYKCVQALGRIPVPGKKHFVKLLYILYRRAKK